MRQKKAVKPTILALLAGMLLVLVAACAPVMPTQPVSGPTATVASLLPTVQPGKFDVDQYLEGLTSASYAFSAAEAMQVGATYKVHLIVSPSEPVPVLVTEVAQPGGKSEGGTVRVDSLMVAHLSGTNFKIEPTSPEEQAVSLKEQTDWSWQVTPLSEGKHTLNLSIYARIIIPGTQTQRQIKTLEREISVNVTFGQRVAGFISENWQWLWTAVLVPVAGYLIARFAKKKAPPPQTR